MEEFEAQNEEVMGMVNRHYKQVQEEKRRAELGEQWEEESRGKRMEDTVAAVVSLMGCAVIAGGFYAFKVGAFWTSLVLTLAGMVMLTAPSMWKVIAGWKGM